MNPQAGRAASFAAPLFSFFRRNALSSHLLSIDRDGWEIFIGNNSPAWESSPGDGREILLISCLLISERSGGRVKEMEQGSLAILLDVSTVGVEAMRKVRPPQKWSTLQYV